MAYITDDWQFSLFPVPLLLQPKEGKSKARRKGGARVGHAGLEAAGWVCSNKPPSFFVVF